MRSLHKKNGFSTNRRTSCYTLADASLGYQRPEPALVTKWWNQYITLVLTGCVFTEFYTLTEWWDPTYIDTIFIEHDGIILFTEHWDPANDKNTHSVSTYFLNGKRFRLSLSRSLHIFHWSPWSPETHVSSTDSYIIFHLNISNQTGHMKFAPGIMTLDEDIPAAFLSRLIDQKELGEWMLHF